MNTLKGLVEGFVAPEPTYNFDHSHAWGGTPLYSLPKALLGFEILKPGMRKKKLNPDILGLEYVNIQMPTVFGMISFEMSENSGVKVCAPYEIDIVE